ncbi:MAG TPA: energy transducer TonB [Gemmatimonadales bacterium]|jgi:TonB family protein
MRLGLAAALLFVPADLAAQGESARLLATAQRHITARQFDSADVALSAAMQRAYYVMDSVSVFVWRGILEGLRDNDTLARVNFRRALMLHAGTGVTGLDKLSPHLAELFDAESRAAHIHDATEVDQKPAWASGPALVYPAALRRRRVAGQAVVTATVDTLGRVEPTSIMIVSTPDSGYIEPLRQMLAATTFTPGRVKTRPVRSGVSLAFNLMPPPPGNPTQFITAARGQLAQRHVDSALALLDEALDPAAEATDGERTYALLVRGMALKAAGRDSLATASIDAGLASYRDLTGRGVDLAPFVRRLADSLRLARRRTARLASALSSPAVIGTADEGPMIISQPAIRYPPEMQALRIGGTVMVEATLETTGHVVPASVQIVQSPNPAFDAEARRVVIATVYRPARLRGRPVAILIRQPITFAPY